MTTDCEVINTTDTTNVLYYQALLSGIDDVIISTDTNFIIQTWNAAAEKIYNLTAAEAIGKRFTDIILHEYVNDSTEEVLRKIIKENRWKGIVRILNNNEDVFLESSFTIVKDESGKKIGYIGISRNVTEELQTRKSLENFASVLALLDESFLIIDKNYRIIYLRPKGNVEKFFKSDSKVGDDALQYVSKKYFQQVKENYERAFKGETVNYNIVSDTEPKLYFNLTYSPLKNEFGEITNVCVIIKDFTAEKEMELLQQRKNAVEKYLYESRQLFEEFMENSPLLAWLADGDGVIHYMNECYLKSFGFTKDDIGKNIRGLYSQEIAEAYLANNKLVLDNKSVVETIEKGSVAGQVKNYKTIKFPIRYKDRNMIAGWAVDITDQITAQENLLQLNQHKNKLVSIIAHDLRAPLGINASFLKTIISEFETYDKDELLDSIKIISKSFTQCYELVDELLRWGRTQLDHIKFNPLPIDVQTEILKVTESLWDQSDKKGIRIETEFNFLGEIFADADMFAIVLRNFVTNAIKFSHANNIVKIKTELVEDKVRVSVIDNGVGMNDELVKKLLDKLNYESEFGTKGEKGTGLGLIISKDYIEQNGGKMGIESKEGAGSNFYFTVPLNSAEK
ncbi:MAG TPA: PAS domain S-box protein [Parafilimonas sp.]|nr:PAS domain S-box protein [Parafilimonas sp.]